MSIEFSEINIRGLRAVHFEQLYVYLKQWEEDGSYYGNKKYFDKRHGELKSWLEGIIEKVKDPCFVIPKKKKG